MSRSFLLQKNINLCTPPCGGGNDPTIAIFEYSGVGPLPNPTADINYYYLSNNNVDLQLPEIIATNQQLFIINIDVNQTVGLFAPVAQSINNISFPNIWIYLSEAEATLIRKADNDRLVGIKLPGSFVLAIDPPQTVVGSSNNAGISNNAAREDHQHRLEVQVEDTGVLIGLRPTLNFIGANIIDDGLNDRVIITIPSPTSLSNSNPLNVSKSLADPGVSTEASRSDHKHDIDTAAPITVTGQINLEGTSTSLTRADHLHRLELQVQRNGALVGSRPIINFIGPSVVDDGGNDRVDITVNSTFTTATPLSVTANSTQNLTGSEITLMSGNITVPANASGNVMIVFSGNGTLGTFVIGTNGIQIRLRFNGSTITTSTRVMQYTATLAISLTLDSEELGTQALVTGIAAGTYLVEILAVKVGATSTASFTGNRSLIAYSV